MSKLGFEEYLDLPLEDPRPGITVLQLVVLSLLVKVVPLLLNKLF